MTLRPNKMQKAIVPIALATALICISPFNRAGGAARLYGNKARFELASAKTGKFQVQETKEPAEKRLPDYWERKQMHPNPGISGKKDHAENEMAQMVERTPEARGEHTPHEGGSENGAPWWVKFLAGASALVGVSMFYPLYVRQVWKTKNTESFSLSSRVMSLAGALLWIGYGFSINDWNIIGWTSSIIPGLFYLTFLKIKNKDKTRPSEPKEKALLGITNGAAVLAFTALAAIEYLFGNRELGILATGLGFVAAILKNSSSWTQTVKTVIDKSTKSFNPLFTVLAPLLAVPWVVYGWMQNEMPVMVTNLLDFVGGTIILWIKVKNWKEDKEGI